MDETKIQEINETIVKAMGYKLYVPLPRDQWNAYSVEPPMEDTYRDAGYSIEICDFDPDGWKEFDPHTSKDDVFKAIDAICGKPYVIYINQTMTDCLAELIPLKWKGKRQQGGAKTPEAAICAALVKFIKEKNDAQSS